MLPACLLALFLLVPGLAAQNRVRVGAEASFHRDPDGTLLGTMLPEAEVTVGSRRGDWTEVTFEAWIWTASIEATDRDGFDVVVTASPAENLRREPDGELLARAVTGALFHKIGTRGGWTRVRRTVWIQRALGRSAAPPPAAPLPADTTPKPATRAAPRQGSLTVAERVGLRAGASLLTAPSGPAVGSTILETPATVAERSGDWVRVTLEGWVRRADIVESDLGDQSRLTLQELLAAPERHVGQQVVWRLQFLSLQRADELRPEMPSGQPYLLTRGPLPETGFVYVMVSREDLARWQALPPLEELVVEAVIRTPRLRYLPTPVLELVRLRSGGGPRR